MIAISIQIHHERLADALRKLPGVIEQRVDQAIERTAQEFARAARGRVSKARSILANSIISRRIALMHFEVTTGTNYARAVEEGTGPAAGKASYMPNPLMLRDYVKQRNSISFAGKARADGMDAVRSRAFALAVHIRKYGTKAHPFMEPTRVEMEPRARELVAAATAAGIKEALG